MSQSFASLPSGMKPHRGQLILTLGIISLSLSLLGSLCCAAFPIVGLVMGIVVWVLSVTELKEMERGIMDPAGKGSTKAGMICGIVSCALSLLIILAVGVVFLIALLQEL